jgi:UDP-glucose 4-epimerase
VVETDKQKASPVIKIVVTGATGFLGSYLLPFLVRKGKYQIRAMTRSLKSGLQRESNLITWQQGDLLSRADCLEFATQADAIIHLAHTNNALTSDRDLPGDAMANLIPTLNLLESIKRSGRKVRVIYASSGGAVYGSNTRHVPFREDDPCVPLSGYGIQKLMAEHYLRLAVREGFLTATVFRIANPYGVLLPADRMQGFIGVALRRILCGEKIRLFSPKETVRDYLHIEDMCRAVECALYSDEPYSIINLGSGKGHSLADVLGIMADLLGPFDVEYGATQDYAGMLPSWNVLNISKARRELGWVPEIDLADGIARSCREVALS